mgnify:CR=1 FL=1
MGYDEEARTAAFLCTAKTMDGSPIPTAGKMTFSAGCFLTGKSEQTDVEIPLRLKDYAGDAAAMTPDSAASPSLTALLTAVAGSWFPVTPWLFRRRD